jgi:hypothetical protein
MHALRYRLHRAEWICGHHHLCAKFPTEPAGSDGAPLGWLLLRPISSQELPIRPGHLPLVQDIKANPTNRDGSRRHRARGWSPLGPRQLLAVLLNCCDVELMQPRGLQDPWSSSEFVDDGHPPPRKHVAPWPGNLRTWFTVGTFTIASYHIQFDLASPGSRALR